jgi:ABC-type multidrug transport system fused ATPase/permease subunit
LVLDEATSGLDAGTESNISKALRTLAPSATVVVIAHRLSTVQDADRVFAIEGGRLLAQGTFAEVRKQVPLIEEYVQLMKISD